MCSGNAPALVHLPSVRKKKGGKKGRKAPSCLPPPGRDSVPSRWVKEKTAKKHFMPGRHLGKRKREVQFHSD